jgi:hypothetical protein
VVQATTYDCTRQGVQDAIDALGGPGAQIVGQQPANAKLVGCGERRGGQTVVVQWYTPPANGQATCAYSSSMEIGTQCFGSSSNANANFGNNAGNTAAGVADCVNAN